MNGYKSELDKAMDGFRAAMRDYEAREEREVVLRKGNTLLVKTGRAHVGQAIKANR